MATQRGGRWVARPGLAGLIRLLVVLVPAVAGALASWEVSRIWAQPPGFWPTVGWFLTLVAVAVAVVLVVQRFARRFLPLAWLFSMTLAFPDRTPSRMVTARRAASRRARRTALERLRRDGLGRDAGEASEAALVLVAALGAHDKRTRGHSERVRTLADLLAKEAGLSDEERDKLRWGALLHDIGKLAVPGEILNKPDRPNQEEWATLQRHPEEGAHLVEPLVTWLGPWSDAVGHHHEKWDGSGYPHGLAGEDISLGARILAIADSYEVMTAARAYKVPMSAAAAREELVASAGTHFDPGLVRAFMGISLGALWWTAGVAALLAQIPLLGRVGALPGVARIRTGLAASATAVAAVAALVVAGAVGPQGGHESAVSRTGTVQSAAPAAPPAAPEPTTAAPASDSSAAGEVEAAAAPAAPVASGPLAARPAPSSAKLPADVTPPVAPVPPATNDSSPSPTPVEPGPSSSPVAPPRQFTASGQLVAPNLLGSIGLSLTGMGGGGGRCGPSASQGLDAWVFELPADGPAAGAPLHAVGDDLLGLHNLTVTFVSQDCRTIGRIDTDAADEAGVLPAGTRFVVVTDRLGIGTTVSLTVG